MSINGHRNPARAFVGSLTIVGLTPAYEQALYNLLHEQAEQHGHERGALTGAALYHSVVHEGHAEVFMVTHKETGKPLGAVTYYDCVGTKGHGLYLEDIVTTKAERGNGVGEFAMVGLAQIAQHRNAKSITWECGHNNDRAQRFYDRFGSERCDDRQTWRKIGRLKRAPEYKLFSKLYTVNGSHDDHTVGAQYDDSVDWTNRNFIALRSSHKSGNSAASMLAYRSYSSFRAVNGIHIEAVHGSHEDPAMISGMLEHVGKMQRTTGWSGHVDITVRHAQQKTLAPVLGKYGFAPLTYGDDRMVTRRLHGDTLNDLAARIDTSIIGNVIAAQPSPHRLAKAQNEYNA